MTLDGGKMVSISEIEFIKFTDFVKKNFGLNLAEKRSLVVSRLQNLLLQQDFKNFSEYYDYILSDSSGAAITTLIDKLTTNHTYFMREVEHFYFFRDQILPYLISTAKEKDLRVWSAGCSTGEEPYTLAMIVDSYFGGDKRGWDTKILATDISTRTLKKAMGGIYYNEDLAALPQAWRKIYFTKYNAESSMVSDKLKKEVIFRKLNLVGPEFPFRQKFQVIFCRNVMIYFDSETRHRLVDRFYDFTEPGGYLFIGHSESLNRAEIRYKYIAPSIYRKI